MGSRRPGRHPRRPVRRPGAAGRRDGRAARRMARLRGGRGPEGPGGEARRGPGDLRRADARPAVFVLRQALSGPADRLRAAADARPAAQGAGLGGRRIPVGARHCGGPPSGMACSPRRSDSPSTPRSAPAISPMWWARSGPCERRWACPGRATTSSPTSGDGRARSCRPIQSSPRSSANRAHEEQPRTPENHQQHHENRRERRDAIERGLAPDNRFGFDGDAMPSRILDPQ